MRFSDYDYDPDRLHPLTCRHCRQTHQVREIDLPAGEYVCWPCWAAEIEAGRLRGLRLVRWCAVGLALWVIIIVAIVLVLS